MVVRTGDPSADAWGFGYAVLVIDFRSLMFVLRLFRVVLFGGLLLLAGCDVVGTYCPAVVRPAVEVRAVAVGPDTLTVDQAVGVLRDGTYTDTMRVNALGPEGDTLQFSGAMGRAGTYDVRVEHPGFAPWTRSGIDVNEGECSVHTPERTARLSPIEEAG